jgi:glycine cleavage system H protein
MSEPSGLKYAKTHEWVRVEGGIAVIGITDHAQAELGDVALVLLPEVGRVLQADEKLGEIESIKAVSDLYAPVSGEVVEVNGSLVDSPQLVNDTPFDEGWMIKVKMSNLAELDNNLLNDDDYAALIAEH